MVLSGQLEETKRKAAASLSAAREETEAQRRAKERAIQEAEELRRVKEEIERENEALRAELESERSKAEEKKKELSDALEIQKIEARRKEEVLRDDLRIARADTEKALAATKKAQADLERSVKSYEYVSARVTTLKERVEERDGRLQQMCKSFAAVEEKLEDAEEEKRRVQAELEALVGLLEAAPVVPVRAEAAPRGLPERVRAAVESAKTFGRWTAAEGIKHALSVVQSHIPTLSLGDIAAGFAPGTTEAWVGTSRAAMEAPAKTLAEDIIFFWEN